MSSSSTSVSHCQWPRYGPVPLGRCPDCPRTAPLKRRVTTSDKNGNAGHEYVKCESKPEPGKVRSDFPLFQFRFIFLNFGFSWHWSRGISSNQSRGIKVNICSYFQDLLPCDHFEWLDVYIKRIEKAGTSLVPNLPPAVEELGSATGVAMVQNGVQNADGLAEVKAELKKMNKQLKKLFDLKKQDNLMDAIFYLCAIALGVVYVLIISH